jgi:hypothetical protein
MRAVAFRIPGHIRFRDGLAFEASQGCGLGDDAARIDSVAAVTADPVGSARDPPQRDVDFSQFGEVALDFRVRDDRSACGRPRPWRR